MPGQVQTVLFPKNEWSINEARTWLTEHHYKHLKVDITDDFLRFRQMTPMKGGRYATVTLPNGVELVLHYHK